MTDSLTSRSEILFQLMVRFVPGIVGGIIFAVGLIIRSPPVMGIGLLVFGLANLILGSIELTNWRGLADLFGQYARLRFMSSWLSVAFGILMMLTGFLIAVN